MLNIPAVVEINNQNIHHCIFLGIGPFSLDENKLSRKNFGRKSVEPFFFRLLFRRATQDRGTGAIFGLE